MNWDDVCDILQNGTKDEILNIRCNECNEIITFYYYEDSKNLSVKCNCTLIVEHNLSNVPNCVKYQKKT